jgi:hypothetical protein
MSPDTTDPIAATRQHLQQIAEIWQGFARAKLTAYGAKLPAALRQKLGLSPADRPTPVPGEAVDAAAH